MIRPEDKTIKATPKENRADEQALINRLKAGDSTVIDDMVDHYKDPLFAFIVRMVNDYHVAEDIFQETWIRVIRHIGSFRGESRFSTWLFQIARNVFRDLMRKRKGLFHIPIEEIEETFPEPANEIVESNEMEYVRKIIAELPVKMKEAIVLRYYHDLDIREVSEILGCSEGTVKSRIFNAIKIIRKKRRFIQA